MTRENSRLPYYQDLLSDLPLFKNVPRKAIRELLQLANPRVWEKKTCIFDTTDTLCTFYIVLNGRLKAYQYKPELNRQLTLFLLTGGDAFDVCSMIKGRAHNVFYEALDETELLCIPVNHLKNWMHTNQEFYLNLLEYTIGKMSRLEHYLSDLIMADTCQRLALLLYNHMNPGSREVEILNGLSHTELAALIGTTRTVVGRHMNNFREAGILEATHKEIRILDIQGLQEIIA